MWPLLLSVLIMLSETDRLAARLHMETGAALAGQGLLAQARSAFSRALDLNPDEHYAVLGLARVSALSGSIPLASYWYGTFMERVPGDYRAPLELGLEQPDSILRCGELIRLALELEPSRSDAQMALARLLLWEGDTTGAETTLELVVNGDSPHRVQAGMLLATQYFNAGKNALARDVLSQHPFREEPSAAWLAARTHLAEGDYMRAMDCINRCLSLSPPGDLAASVGEVLDSLAREGLFIPH